MSSNVRPPHRPSNILSAHSQNSLDCTHDRCWIWGGSEQNAGRRYKHGLLALNLESAAYQLCDHRQDS